MIELGTIPLLVRLLSGAQPDGQYSAAAGLYNLATCSAVDAHGMIISAGAIPSLVPMLGAESWCAGITQMICCQFSSSSDVEVSSLHAFA